MYIDTHSHIDFSDFDVDRENILEDALKTGVSSIINVGTDVDSSEFSLKLSEKYDLIKAAVGIHPSEIGNFDLKDMKKICKLAKNDKVVAIGETGLDFYRDRDFVSKQKDFLVMHIQLAREMNLPLIIHQRSSRDEVIEIMEKEELPTKIVFHCFEGDSVLADYCNKKGFYISFTGIITFKKADDVRKICSEYPDDRIMAETDAPFLSPVPFRGKRNDPSKIKYIVEKISEVKGGNLEGWKEKIFFNSKKFFNIL